MNSLRITAQKLRAAEEQESTLHPSSDVLEKKLTAKTFNPEFSSMENDDNNVSDVEAGGRIPSTRRTDNLSSQRIDRSQSSNSNSAVTVVEREERIDNNQGI